MPPRVVDLTTEQARTLLALACHLAWADGHVTNEEQAYVLRLLERLAPQAVSTEELLDWLHSGPPDASITTLPESLGRMFVYQAMELIQVDGDLAPEELELLDQITARIFNANPDGVPVARIRLAKARR